MINWFELISFKDFSTDLVALSWFPSIFRQIIKWLKNPPEEEIVGIRTRLSWVHLSETSASMSKCKSIPSPKKSRQTILQQFNWASQGKDFLIVIVVLSIFVDFFFLANGIGALSKDF